VLPIINTDQFYYRTILDAIPLAVMVVDDDLAIVDLNRGAEQFLSKTKEKVLRKRGGEALNCIHSTDVPEGCGHGPQCHACVIRNSVQKASGGDAVQRHPTNAEFVVGDAVRNTALLISTSPIRLYGKALVLLVLEDMTELARLRSLVPMCSHCKRIRVDAEYWQHLEVYFRDYLGLDVTHSLCVDCLHELYPEHSENILKRRTKK
jgi:hypothetical protein